MQRLQKARNFEIFTIEVSDSSTKLQKHIGKSVFNGIFNILTVACAEVFFREGGRCFKIKKKPPGAYSSLKLVILAPKGPLKNAEIGQ